MVVYPHNWDFSLDLHFQVLPPNNAFPFSDKAIWILSINTRKYVGCSQESWLGGFSFHYCSFSNNGHTIHSCFPRRSYLPRWFETTNLSMCVQRRKVLYCFWGKPPDHVVHLTSFGRLEIDMSLWNFHIHSVAHSTTMVSFVYCTYTTPSFPPFLTSQLHPTQPLQAVCSTQHPSHVGRWKLMWSATAVVSQLVTKAPSGKAPYCCWSWCLWERYRWMMIHGMTAVDGMLLFFSAYPLAI